LNNAKEQIIRLYIKDESSNVIAFKDIKIIKTYVTEDIDIGSIIFE
jgi:ribosomal protein S18